eukprot:m.238032 g.238032  ORF g.238032 m.238032 type:complete len:380 (+) comp18963_c0_seq5:678-1817(+)
MNFHTLELAFSVVGIAGALCIIAVYIAMPKTRAHPSSIILLIAISDFFLALRFMVRGVAWLVHPDPYAQPRSMHIFDDDCVSSMVWVSLFETLSVAWNCTWCVDLILQLKNPRHSTEHMMRWYILYTSASSAAMTVIHLAHNSMGPIVYGEYEFCGEHDQTLHNPAMVVKFVFTMLQLVVACVSLFYVYQRLRFLTSELDSVQSLGLLKRHAAYVFVFIVLWSAQIIVTVIGHEDMGVHQWVALLWMAQAFPVALVRLSEPHLLPTLIRGMSCCTPNREREPLLDDVPSIQTTSQDPPSPLDKSFFSFSEGANASNLSSSSTQWSVEPPWGPSTSVRAELELADAAGGNRISFKTPPRRQTRPRAESIDYTDDEFGGDI